MKHGNIGSGKLHLYVCHSKLLNVFTIKIIENPIKNRFHIQCVYFELSRMQIRKLILKGKVGGFSSCLTASLPSSQLLARLHLPSTINPYAFQISPSLGRDREWKDFAFQKQQKLRSKQGYNRLSLLAENLETDPGGALEKDIFPR